jgi:hypothetical protein
MRRPPEAFRESMEVARWCRAQTFALPWPYCVKMRCRTTFAWPGTYMDARRDTRALLAGLRAAREEEKRWGVGE